ncbi:hypothetical protein C1T31_07155 [Hanstruepera neustonica]|uniref:Colanic acid exporter n=1 Tax=Hanstruepera neustonica TaxID=1445657 RepID=A0A2K1DZ36_9FLAO|nr:lipopolysaccharide biosynthesis protein [Hanstruepera neustonica]PNQ73290.1 hypothetical protein C1T31_07155 [Hanstruepera neustonica]
MDKNKIIKGGFYLTIVNVLSQLLAIVVNIVLARLLLPEDFGLVALAMTFIGFITLFTNMGFGSSIIHERNSSQNQLSSLFWLNYTLSIGSFIIIVASAQLAASFYNEPKLTSIVQIAALSILLNPIFIIHYKLLERDLEFRIISQVNLASIVIGSLSAIIGAFIGLGVYALILQTLMAVMVRLVLVLLLKKWRPKLHFNFEEIRQMVWYSMKFKASDMALYFERNVDYLILGKFFTSVILGYYAFAYNIMYTPVKRISYIFSDILFPSFSSIKDDSTKIISGYYKSLRLIGMVSIPVMSIIAFNAEFIIQTVFGEKWDAAIPIVQILCFAGAIQSISQFGGVIFSSIGKPEVRLYISAARSILTVIAIIVGVQYGVLWVAYLLVLAKLMSFIMFLIILNYHISISIHAILNSLKASLLTLLILSVMFVLFESNKVSINEWFSLILMCLIATIIIYSIHRTLINEIFLIIKNKAKAGS